MRDRPSFVDALMAEAFLVTCRSPDEQTHVGCVIANDKNVIIGQGFNGFPRGMRDHELPSTRPEKYPWMRHAERNAVDNCSIKPVGCVAYVTTEPCHDCLTHLWCNGIIKVVAANTPLAACVADGENQRLIKIFLDHVPMKIEYIDRGPALAILKERYEWFSNG